MYYKNRAYHDEELPNFDIPNKDLPRRVWRVKIPGSATPYSPDNGFGVPRDEDTKELGNSDRKVPRNEGRKKGISIFKRSQLLPAVREHLDWDSRKPSPFISTFIERSHAEAWGRNWLRKNDDVEAVDLVEINPRMITTPEGKRLPIISALEVVDYFQEEDGEDILPEFLSEHQVEDELLCLYHIPKSAILKIHPLRRAEDEGFYFDDMANNEGCIGNHNPELRNEYGGRGRNQNCFTSAPERDSPWQAGHWRGDQRLGNQWRASRWYDFQDNQASRNLDWQGRYARNSNHRGRANNRNYRYDYHPRGHFHPYSRSPVWHGY